MPAEPQHAPRARVAFLGGGLVDAPAVAALAAESFVPLYREAWNAAQVAAVVAVPSGLLELAVADGRLRAFALGRLAADEVELLLCASAPSWRMLGLGRGVLEALAARAAAAGARRLFLEVRDGNDAAMALYRAAGLRQVGRRKAYYRTANGAMLDAITMAREIT